MVVTLKLYSTVIKQYNYNHKVSELIYTGTYLYRYITTYMPNPTGYIVGGPHKIKIFIERLLKYGLTYQNS